MAAACIDPGARLCLLRHLHALRRGHADKPCHGCEPAAETVAILRSAKTASCEISQTDPNACPQPDQAPPAERSRAAAWSQAVAVAIPSVGWLDLAALRAVLLPVLEKQGRTKQKTLYVERLQGLYNAKAAPAARIKAKRRFREALAAVPGLALEGSSLALDQGCRAFCVEGK